jgi:type I restriction enzyme S subunit
MVGEWQRLVLADVIDLISGGTPRTSAPEYWGGDIPWLSVADFNTGYRWVSGAEKSITDRGLSESATAILNQGDIIISARGTVGVAAQLAKPMAFNQSCYGIRGKRGIAETDFIYYALRHTVSEMKRVAHGGVFDTITRDTFKIIEVDIPPLLEQRAIAHILGTLDDKIELNRRMNETLEATARAIFKSWFVNFDPVRAKAGLPSPSGKGAGGEGAGLPQPLADLFPDSFEDSELGEIPKGWRVGRFGDVVEQLRDQENPLSSPDVLFHHYSLPAFDDGQNPQIEYGGSIKSLKSRVPAGVILLSKLNPEIERVWMVDVRPDERAVCSTEFLVLRARIPFARNYVYCLTRSPIFRQQIKGLVTGTSKSHQRAQVDSILNLTVVFPPSSVVAAFERYATGLLERPFVCRRESRALTALRDTLLPKLISGELRVNRFEPTVWVVA